MRRRYLQLYFFVMPAHVLVEHRRDALRKLSTPACPPASDDTHNPFDPSLPAFMRRQAD